MTTIDNPNAGADANNGNDGNDEKFLNLGDDNGANGGNDGGDDNGNDSKNNGRILSDEDKLAMLDRQASRLRKRLGRDDDSHGNKPSAKKGKGSDAPEGFDYGQMAFLEVKGLKTQEQQDLAWEAMQSSGKDLKTVLGSKWFQEDLAALATKAAMPNGGNRAGSPAGYDTVEYWIAKDELPPADQVELRRKVVNAKIAKASGGSHFTDNPTARR